MPCWRFIGSGCHVVGAPWQLSGGGSQVVVSRSRLPVGGWPSVVTTAWFPFLGGGCLVSIPRWWLPRVGSPLHHSNISHRKSISFRECRSRRNSCLQRCMSASFCHEETPSECVRSEISFLYLRSLKPFSLSAEHPMVFEAGGTRVSYCLPCLPNQTHSTKISLRSEASQSKPSLKQQGSLKPHACFTDCHYVLYDDVSL